MEDSLNNIICPVDSEWKFNKEVLKCLKDNGGLNVKCYYAFNIPGLQYYVNIHPNGCSEDTRGRTLIFFHVNGSSVRKIDANVTIAIKSTRYSKILIHVYESNIGRIGFWCEASDFFHSESKYFVNDTVTVKVKGTLKAEQLLIPKIVSPILIQWKINENDLKAKQHDASKGYLRSAKVDVVQFSDVQYFLSIYPYRIKEGKQLQACLYFGVELKNEKKIEAVYDFSVDSVSFNSGHQYFFEKTHSRGTTLCLSDDLFDSSKKYFVDGILTITLNGILMKESIKKFIELPCIGLITKEDEENNNKDFEIIVDEKCIKVHKQVLKLASPVLAGIPGSEMAESIENQIVIKDFEFKIVDVAIKILYNINIFRRLSIEDILSLYKFGNKYEIHRITDIVEDYLFKEISPANIVHIFLFFKDVRVARLRERCIDRLIQYHKESVAVYSLESLDKYLLFVSILSNSWHRIVYTDTTST